jgi:hypothetical protein
MIDYAIDGNNILFPEKFSECHVKVLQHHIDAAREQLKIAPAPTAARPYVTNRAQMCPVAQALNEQVGGRWHVTYRYAYNCEETNDFMTLAENAVRAIGTFDVSNKMEPFEFDTRRNAR